MFGVWLAGVAGYVRRSHRFDTLTVLWQRRQVVGEHLSILACEPEVVNEWRRGVERVHVDAWQQPEEQRDVPDLRHLKRSDNPKHASKEFVKLPGGILLRMRDRCAM